MEKEKFLDWETLILLIKSKSYNHIENTHQIILLSLVDLVIGKSEYKVNTKK